MSASYSFSEFLKDKLIQQGQNVFAFSKLIGIDDFVISRWVNEQFLPSLNNIEVIADYFDISIDYIIGLKELADYKKAKLKENFPLRLRKLLHINHITPYKLAKDCRFGSSTVSKWLLKKCLPGIDSLIKLAKYFNCSVDYLVGRED